MNVLKEKLSLCVRTCIPIKVMAALFCVLILGLFSPNYAHAAICFLPDCEDRKVNEGGDTGAEACLNAGYESDKSLLCNEYSIIKYCPQNSNYIKCDDPLWCSINGYVETECEPPYELFNKCPNGQEMYKECKLSMEDVCKAENENYVDLCPAGWTLDPNKMCSYSDEWGECCNMCPGFEYTSETLPPGAQAAASCKSCDGMRYIISNIGDICEGFWDCQDGCEIGSETCLSYNGNIKCKTCKRCEAKCSNETCPDGAECEYENCTQRYCDPTGCKVGYTYFCKMPETTNCYALGYDTPKGTCDGMGEIECPFDDNVVWCIPDNGDCCYIKCEGYDYDYEDIPTGYTVTGSCACCGKTKFKVVENACAGFVTADSCEWGVKDGTETCLKGSELLYKECKSCPNATTNRVCPNGYTCTKDECSGTYIITGCANGYKYFCDTPNLSCESLGYNMTLGQCAAGVNILYCPYDVNKVICDNQDILPCEYYCNAYPHTSIPNGYHQTASKTCCGTTYYQVEPNACSGFVHADECEYGPDTTSNTCLSGTETMYASCQVCENVCLDKCPYGAVCNFDSCSQTYCPTGCASGYDYFCGNPEFDCGALGYRNIEFDCSNKNMLRCPYNSNYVICD